ncbi:hypothetical protein JB92DRAFT_791110 [Gautieria morchelliformis]|nr:hypothetical protein JB92DRAFT_791110 [Gautieria morchelliformis]
MSVSNSAPAACRYLSTLISTCVLISSIMHLRYSCVPSLPAHSPDHFHTHPHIHFCTLSRDRISSCTMSTS